MSYLNQELFNKIQIKLIVSVVDFNLKTYHKHSHPGKFDIQIPIDKFSKDELNFLRENEMNFHYQDNVTFDGETYSCYKVKKRYVYTNSINLLGLK